MATEPASDNKTLRRVPIKLVAVLGLGLLVALAIGSVLFIGFSVAMKNTDDLLSDKIEISLDNISARLDMHLQPVELQAIEITQAFADGTLSLNDKAKLRTYLSGILSASPQVSAIAIAKPDKTMTGIRRRVMKIEEIPWPSPKKMGKYFREIIDAKTPQWRPPAWSEDLQQIVVTSFMPLHHEDRFVGFLIQTVPIVELSRYLSQETNHEGVPFILYNADKLIAHPNLINWRPLQNQNEGDSPPVATVQGVGDSILDNLLKSPGFEPKIISGLKRSRAKVVRNNERDYLLFTRPITRYGSEQWTLGIYLNASTSGDTVKRLLLAFIVGIVFLILSVGLAMYAGSKFSWPIRALAAAMQQVRDGKIADVSTQPRNRISELDDAAQSFNKMVQGLRERDLIRQTLGRYVPKKVAESLLKENGSLETEETVATVLFTDIEGFTSLTENLGPEGIVELLNAFFSDMVEIIERHDGVVTQFQGDAILATFNIPIKNERHASNALEAALEMYEHLLSHQFAGQTLRARIGVNTGYLVAGAVGAQGRLNYTVHGDAVNLAARVENLNKEHGTYILTTGSTIDQAEGFDSKYVGETKVRGQTTPVKLYTLNSDASGS